MRIRLVAGCCWLMETNGFPLIDVPLAGSRSTAGFAHPAGCGGAKRCFAKPRLRPGGRPTFLRRQESRQRSDPCFTGLLLKRCLIKSLPCAARIGRPAQNSPAARAQTAAPEGPAQCSAARRLRRGFQQTSRLYWNGLCDQSAEKHSGLSPFAFRLSPFAFRPLSDHTCPPCNAR